MFTLGEIATWVAGFAFFPVLGWLSLRYLRAAPDVPHRAEMIRGAKWGGLIMSLCLMGPMFTAGVMARHAVPYALTALGGSYMVIGAYLIVARWWLVWEGTGVFLVLFRAGQRMRGEPADLSAVVDKFEKQQRSRWARVLPWVGGMIFLLWTGVTVLGLVPMDRRMQAVTEGRALEADAMQALGDLPLKTVMVDGHVRIWSPLLPMPERMSPTSIPGHPNASLLWIGLEADAPEGSFERASAAAEALLEAKGMRGEWMVRVTAGDERRLEVIWHPSARE